MTNDRTARKIEMGLEQVLRITSRVLVTYDERSGELRADVSGTHLDAGAISFDVRGADHYALDRAAQYAARTILTPVD